MIREIKLDFKGTTVHFRFGLGFLGQLIKRTDLDVGGIIEEMRKNPFDLVPIMMDEASRYADIRNGVDHTRTEVDFVDLLDDCGGMDSKQFIDFMNGFTASITKGVPEAKVNKAQPAKKKRN
jgi:hypothetical protein